MKEIEIIRPDDWHVHFRDNDFLSHVVPETSRHFARAIVMPNLIPPITSGENAIKYKNRIQRSIPKDDDFNPLMTLYLTENTNKDDLKTAYKNSYIFAAKLYPAGATTNSSSGVKNITKILPILSLMSEIGMPLLIHGEVTNDDIDIFDREKEFIDKILNFICTEFPELKITLEHITTKYAVEFISNGNKNLAASITPHHLALNRNSILVGGIKPHYYCLPVLKREIHRKALIQAATSKNSKFFLGTDSAPHLKKDKESECGCAGIFNSTYCMSIIAQIFETEESLDSIESFTSINGAKHYGLPINNDKIKLVKDDEPILFQESLIFDQNEIKMFNPNFPVFWRVASNID